MQKDYWPTDGTKHHDVSRSSFYTNAKIDNFLDNDSHTLIVAAKGMGKTLLLRAKKKILEDDPAGTLIVPRKSEYDEPQFHGSFSKSGLDEVSFWEDLWKCSIIFSILSHCWGKSSNTKENNKNLRNHIDRLKIDENFKSNLVIDIVENNENNPSYYLSDLLVEGIGTVQKFLKTTHIVDALSDKYVNHSISVFIDGFDQTLTKQFSHSLLTWRSAQLGLAKAAHRLNTQNRHIKVYASIRQEAYSGFSDDDREVIKGSSLLLEYSSKELELILEHAIKKYTKYKSLNEFCHLSKIYNGWCKKEENLFSYIYRHSTATPRSIIYFGKVINDSQLELLDKDDVQNTLRDQINKTGSENLYKDYLLGQKRIFLNTLDSEKKIKKILSLIPANILHAKSLKSINNKFSELVGIDESTSHPFCELYNIGLIGTIRLSPSSNKPIQYFRKPYEFNWVQREIVRDDAIYLIHPSLHFAITEEKSDYYLNPSNILGDERPWNIPKDNKIFPLLFISHSSIDKKRIEQIIPIFETTLNRIFPSSFWYDKWNIRAGGDIHQEVEKGVEGSDFVIVFISKDSLKSGWVEKEWRKKHYDEITNKKIQVIAIIIDNTEPSELPGFLKTKKAIILPNRDEGAYAKIFINLSNDIAYYITEHNKRMNSD